MGVALAALLLVGTVSLFAGGAAEPATMEAEPPYDIAFIVKATDSDFWQYTIVGARAFAAENPDLVRITEFGPPSEADIDQQVLILEDVIAAGYDAIVIASTSSDATVPAIERAVAAGTPVITIDNRVNTADPVPLLATDNKVGGALAADMMLEAMEEHGIEPRGKVGLISAMAGVQVLVDRDDGFLERIAEIAPEIEMLETRYVDNDITVALAAAEDLITAHGDELIGIFADNNHTGIGVSRAIIEQGLEDEVMVVAFDSDPAEVEALEQGAIKALIVQDPFRMGHEGVEFAVRALEGEWDTLPRYLDTEVAAVTQENMDQKQELLDPFLRQP
ncbi:MAG: LacI family transcriptional regulator [Spirochaetaceae bacterium]|nr:MAG: LacI family transcriptional regulator [Spirochaetaceae bacterium]